MRRPTARTDRLRDIARTPTLALLLVSVGCVHSDTKPDVRLRSIEAFGPRYQPGPAARPQGAEQPPERAELFETADLDLYLSFGLHHHAGLRASFAQWQAALEQIAQVTSLPDPVFTFGQFLQTIETRTGPQERRYSLQQTIPWFGELEARGDVAAAHAEALWHRVLATRLEVERDIAVAYHDYAYLGRTTRITGEVLALLRQLEPTVSQRIAGGSAGQEELLRLQVEISRVENELRSFEEVRRSMSARLAAAMQLEGQVLLPIPELAEPDALPPLDPERLVARAIESSPSLRQANEEVRRFELARDLAGFERYPDLTFGVDYFETDTAIGPTPDSGDDPIALRVSLNLPIWAARYDAAEKEAEMRATSARQTLAHRRARLGADVEHATFELGDAARQLALYADSLLPRARESLRITRIAYEADRASLLDVIDSERALLEFETAYWRACRDQRQSLARLESLLGGPLQTGALR